MMQIEQCRSLGKQSMRISGEEHSEEHGDFREQMLLHNKVEGILPFEIINENGHRIYEYSVTGMETLASLCARKKLRADVLGAVISKLLKSVYHGHEFMLLEDDYVVTPETVFTDGKEKTEVAYFSGYGKSLRTQLRSLSEYLMDNIDYNDDAAVLMIYSFYMKTKEESCTIEELMGIAAGQQKEKEPEEEIRAAAEAEPRGEVRAAAMAEHEAFREIKPQEEEKALTPADIVKAAPKRLLVTSVLIPLAAVLTVAVLIKTGLLINGKTLRPDVVRTLLCAGAGLLLTVAAERYIWRRFAAAVEESCRLAEETGDEATLLLCNDGVARYPFSLVSDEYPAIQVSRVPFFIGKDPKTSDYVLNRAGVSRYHMKIDKEGDGYTVSDMSSTNGTFVNGKRLAAYKPQAVKRGDEIRIAACIFYCN